MPRRSHPTEDAQRRQINRQAWTEAELVARAHFEERRRALLVAAGLAAPRRRTDQRGRRRPDPLRHQVEELVSSGGFDDDPSLRAVAEAFLKEPWGRHRLALYRRLMAVDNEDNC